MIFNFVNNTINLYDTNDTIIGYVMLGQQSTNVFRILRVFVDEAYRGQGLAKKLMDEAVRLANQNSFKYIPVCTYAVAYFNKPDADTNVLVN